MRRLMITLILIAACACADASELELTVYNSDLALVKESRELKLSRGVQEYPFTGVPQRLMPATVHFLSLTDPDGTTVLEQNYRYDLLDRGSLLERYRGKQVRALVDGNWEKVRLLSPGNPTTDQQPVGRILEIGGEIHIEGFILPSLPEGLLLEPTLVWLLDAKRAGRHDVELSYLTGGLSWQADYVAVIREDDALDLTGWVTLNNSSGLTYENARLKLVAGDVNRVRREMQHKKGGRGVPMAVAFDAAQGFQEEEFFEYHLYTLGRPTTVRDREQKQVELLRHSGIDAERKYVFRSSIWQQDEQPRAIAVMMEFANEKGKGPGVPLPKGTVRVYKADKGGQLQFAGEDNIPHTPEGERVSLKLGEAFDIRGERIQTRIDRARDRRIVEQDFQITLRNRKDEQVKIDVIEVSSAYREWKVRAASHDHKRLSASKLSFTVTVPAKGETVITYTLRSE
jgi:hypothetical protein